MCYNCDHINFVVSSGIIVVVSIHDTHGFTCLNGHSDTESLKLFVLYIIKHWKIKCTIMDFFSCSVKAVRYDVCELFLIGLTKINH